MERIGCGKMNDLMKCTALDRERGANAAVRRGLKKKKKRRALGFQGHCKFTTVLA